MSRYRKKPVEIEAFQLSPSNPDQVAAWCGGEVLPGATAGQRDGTWHVAITTLEGVMTAAPGDYVIRGLKGEFYPCKPDIFAATYDPVTVESAV